MLEDALVWIISSFWKLLTMVLTGIFTKQSIPIIIFFVLAVLFFIAFMYLQLKYKGKFVRVRKFLGYAALASFMLSMVTVGVSSKGLAVDTLDQSVNIFPTGDYVIVGISENIGGENINICPIKDFESAKYDTTGTLVAWKKTRFAHFIPEQLYEFQPHVGQEITIALIGKDMRVFKRLEPLPGNTDEEEVDHQTELGMLTP